MLHLQSPVYISLKVPRKEKPPLQVPLMEPLHRERCSISRALFTYLSKSPEKKNPPSRFLLWSPYIEKDAPSPDPSIYLSKSPEKKPPPGSPDGAPI
jgi:hypothetical protein